MLWGWFVNECSADSDDFGLHLPDSRRPVGRQRTFLMTTPRIRDKCTLNLDAGGGAIDLGRQECREIPRRHTCRHREVHLRVFSVIHLLHSEDDELQPGVACSGLS